MKTRNKKDYETTFVVKYVLDQVLEHLQLDKTDGKYYDTGDILIMLTKAEYQKLNAYRKLL